MKFHLSLINAISLATSVMLRKPLIPLYLEVFYLLYHLQISRFYAKDFHLFGVDFVQGERLGAWFNLSMHGCPVFSAPLMKNYLFTNGSFCIFIQIRVAVVLAYVWVIYSFSLIHISILVLLSCCLYYCDSVV